MREERADTVLTSRTMEEWREWIRVREGRNGTMRALKNEESG